MLSLKSDLVLNHLYNDKKFADVHFYDIPFHSCVLTILDYFQNYIKYTKDLKFPLDASEQDIQLFKKWLYQQPIRKEDFTLELVIKAKEISDYLQSCYFRDLHIYIQNWIDYIATTKELMILTHVIQFSIPVKLKLSDEPLDLTKPSHRHIHACRKLVFVTENNDINKSKLSSEAQEIFEEAINILYNNWIENRYEESLILLYRSSRDHYLCCDSVEKEVKKYVEEKREDSYLGIIILYSEYFNYLNLIDTSKFNILRPGTLKQDCLYNWEKFEDYGSLSEYIRKEKDVGLRAKLLEMEDKCFDSIYLFNMEAIFQNEKFDIQNSKYNISRAFNQYKYRRYTCLFGDILSRIITYNSSSESSPGT